ncbi:hypothetical protein NP233_g7690 [Leucocoprinus birnbaumii]|uniref:Prolyl 4-hydroxylase alpha subunit Fe(2+) 2OG dioxygenase domain-containing protein n=1 Tax=Leucocoprinus birnbaumii TaxID=56174 RepID=A0AAD5YNR5_9AGAR|nr:hypothetical protein NP233_g7690 [Leucocoprinus birnbaumii]
MAQDPVVNLQRQLLAQERWHEPWTTGTVNLSGSESTLFYKRRDGSSRQGSTTAADIEALLNACQPVTFGRGGDTILDETHRKAWTMDVGAFSWLFNPDSGRFTAELAQGLCPWDQLDRGIRIEVDKLNVYASGGFFKSHKNKPRGVEMFGSLVVVLPVKYEGGSLFLRHGGRELEFDANRMLEGLPSATIAYAAFYSDVDHEVADISSGHRVTISYNLYFDSSRTAPPPGRLRRVPDNPFTSMFRQYLRRDSFLASQRYLGFGMEYPYPKRADEYDGNLIRHLKGPDAFLYHGLLNLGARPQLRYLYRSEYGSCDFWVMLSHPTDGRRTNAASPDTELEFLIQEPDSSIVWAKGKTRDLRPVLETEPSFDDTHGLSHTSETLIFIAIARYL